MPENLPRKRPKGAHEGALRYVIPPANLETSPFGFVLRFDLRGNRVSAHIIPCFVCQKGIGNPDGKQRSF